MLPTTLKNTHNSDIVLKHLQGEEGLEGQLVQAAILVAMELDDDVGGQVEDVLRQHGWCLTNRPVQVP